MDLPQRLAIVSEQLQQQGIDDARLEAEYLVAAVLNRMRTELVLLKNASLSDAQEEHLKTLLSRRLQRIPLAYVLEEQPFMDLSLKVGPSVLIPRPETEELVEHVQKQLLGYPAARIADIGTGSGAIAIVLAKDPHVADVCAVDISVEALSVAQENAKRNQAEGIRWFQGDLLDPLAGESPFDFILANLPYVRTGELAHVMPEVRCEPRLALDGGQDGLDLIARLIRQARPYLKPTGSLVLEMGIGQTAGVLELLSKAGFAEPAVLLDSAGIPRIVQSHREAFVGSLHA